MKKTILFTAFILCFAGTANAQFFKKLGEKVGKAAEKAVERKAEQKTTKETNKAFDSTFNKKRKNKRGGVNMPGVSKVEPASSYSFNHKSEIKFTSGKDEMFVDYYLPNSGNFLAAAIKDKKIQEDFYTVFDVDRESMFTFMNNNGQKIKMAVSFKTDDATDDDAITITDTGNTKTILGYNCKEYKMSGEDMTASIWVTNDVDIRFPSTFHNIKQDKTANQAWMEKIDGWAMHMEMVDTSRRKPQTITMTCLSIEKSDMKINSKEYQNIGGH